MMYEIAWALVIFTLPSLIMLIVGKALGQDW